MDSSIYAIILQKNWTSKGKVKSKGSGTCYSAAYTTREVVYALRIDIIVDDLEWFISQGHSNCPTFLALVFKTL